MATATAIRTCPWTFEELGRWYTERMRWLARSEPGANFKRYRAFKDSTRAFHFGLKVREHWAARWSEEPLDFLHGPPSGSKRFEDLLAWAIRHEKDFVSHEYFGPKGAVALGVAGQRPEAAIEAARRDSGPSSLNSRMSRRGRGTLEGLYFLVRKDVERHSQRDEILRDLRDVLTADGAEGSYYLRKEEMDRLADM
jgi:hypothetical protein